MYLHGLHTNVTKRTFVFDIQDLEDELELFSLRRGRTHDCEVVHQLRNNGQTCGFTTHLYTDEGSARLQSEFLSPQKNALEPPKTTNSF